MESASVLSKRSAEEPAGSKRQCAARGVLSEVFKQPVFLMKHYCEEGRGEYRCCVFRSDRAGAVGKIVFNVSGPLAGHVTVVSIHESCRGAGLGRLLFQECFNVLRLFGVERVHLEAEEDIKRHNKLVHWYETMGFTVKSNAKITFLSNNDHQTFRKVPMECELAKLEVVDYFMEDQHQFLPIYLTTPTGLQLAVNERGMLQLVDSTTPAAKQWMVAQSRVGAISLESNFGRFLCAEPTGVVVANRPWQDCWELFDVELIHNTSSFARRRTGSDDDDDEDDSAAPNLCTVKTFHGLYLAFDTSGNVYTSTTPILWAANGAERAFSCLNVPNSLGSRRSTKLCACQECLELRGDCAHALALARKLAFNLTAPRCQQLRATFLQFSQFKASVYDMLLRLFEHKDPMNPAIPVSYGELLLRTAEYVRDAGHPDWLQFIALIHGLGRALYFPARQAESTAEILPRNRDEDPGQSYQQWAMGGISWLVDEPLPASVASCLQLDEADVAQINEYNNATHQSKAGAATQDSLAQHSLLWGPCEYMYHWLVHNHSSVPQEGLAIVRYLPLHAWYGHNDYPQFCAEEDEENKAWVQQFSALKTAARTALMHEYELRASSEAEHAMDWAATVARGKELLQERWPYYQAIVDKYLPASVLDW